MPSTPASERPAGDCSTGLWGDAVPRSGTEARAMVSSADVTEPDGPLRRAGTADRLVVTRAVVGGSGGALRQVPGSV